MKVDIDSPNSVKYTLRTKSLLKRIESERTRQGSKKKEPKEKPKPPPLSKYRRKTANARERNRMREMNEAFETLQKTLPNLPGADADKLTKITVLRLAVNYIKILSCVIDGDIIVPQDIDELKEMWCLKNAHMTRPEHCVRSVFRSAKLSSHQPISKPTKLVSIKHRSTKHKLATNGSAIGSVKDKNGNVIKKRPAKSTRTRGKICKTASVATSNGAYITLKNVAFQTPASRRTHLDNKPLMMSMIVKRPRMETISYQRPPKFSRYEPPTPSVPKHPKMAPIMPPLITSIKPYPIQNAVTNNNCFAFSNPTITESITNLPPYSLLPTTDFQSSVENKYLTNFTIYDLDSPVIKNDVTLKYPCKNRQFSSPSLDSTFSSEDSIPLSPKSPLTFPFSNIGTCSPSHSSRSLSSVSPSSFSFSDTDSVLAPSVELDTLLGSEPFEEELDHLTSSFVEADDALNLFLEHTTNSNFIGNDINSC